MLPEIPFERICDSLEALIIAKENKELQCRDYLKYAKELLVRETVTCFVYIEPERRGNSGNPDYIISGVVQEERGLEGVRAYIWELKAPQCYLFEKETENRLIPSKELFKAENQLLHYYHELKGNEQARHDFGVTHPDYVRFGGIIIGNKNRLVDGNFTNEKKRILYEKAIMVRGSYFYDPLHIRIITWDRILEQLREKITTQRQPPEMGPITAKSLGTENIEIITPLDLQ